MTVGSQGNQAQVNQTLTSLAIQWRNLALQTLQQGQYLNKEGLTGLEGMGFSAADAATVLTLINYMTTVAGCYKGTVQQGGANGTGAIMFNFEDALTPLWAGQ